MKVKMCIALLSILFVAGCVPSLHQLWTKETLVYDETISGKYGAEEDCWQFTGNPNDKSYELVITAKEDGEKKVSKLSARLVNVKGQLFFDLCLEDEIDAGLYTKMHLIAAHTFWKVEKTEKGFSLAMMDPEQVGKLLKEKPDLVRHEFVEDSPLVLTDTPENLQKFLIEAQKLNKDIFGDSTDFVPVTENDTVIEP